MALPDGTFMHDPELVAAYSSLHLSGGGLWSSAEDLLRFGRAMFAPRRARRRTRLLSPAYVDLMTREVTVRRRRGSPASARTRIRWPPITTRSAGASPGVASIGARSAFGHGGVSGTRLWIDPTLDLVYVYLSGGWGMSREPIDVVEAAIYARPVIDRVAP